MLVIYHLILIKTVTRRVLVLHLHVRATTVSPCRRRKRLLIRRVHCCWWRIQSFCHLVQRFSVSAQTCRTAPSQRVSPWRSHLPVQGMGSERPQEIDRKLKKINRAMGKYTFSESILLSPLCAPMDTYEPKAPTSPTRAAGALRRS